MECIDAKMPRVREELDSLVDSGRRQRALERLGCAGAVLGCSAGLGLYIAGFFDAMVVAGLVAGAAYFLSTTVDATLEDDPRLQKLREALASLEGVLDEGRAMRLEFDLRAYDVLPPETKVRAAAGALDLSYRQRWLTLDAYGVSGARVVATIDLSAKQREDGIEVVGRSVEETLRVMVTAESGQRVDAEALDVAGLVSRVDVLEGGARYHFVAEAELGAPALAAAIRACLERVEPCPAVTSAPG